MIIKTKLGKLESLGVGEKQIDYLDLEWYELSKRIINKSTRSGREVFLKFLGQSEPFQQDDVLYADQDQVIAVDVIGASFKSVKIRRRTADLFELTTAPRLNLVSFSS